MSLERPTRYRTKPVEIVAMRYTRESRDALIDWCKGIVHRAISEEGAEYELENLRIRTLEGTMQVALGDWVIKGVKGEFYPCKPDIFDATYEFVGRYPE